MVNTFWETLVLEGVGLPVPPLLGLETLTRRKAKLDIHGLTLELDEPDGSRFKYPTFRGGGHLILPCDRFQNA